MAGKKNVHINHDSGKKGKCAMQTPGDKNRTFRPIDSIMYPDPSVNVQDSKRGKASRRGAITTITEEDKLKSLNALKGFGKATGAVASFMT